MNTPAHHYFSSVVLCCDKTLFLQGSIWHVVGFQPTRIIVVIIVANKRMKFQKRLSDEISCDERAIVPQILEPTEYNFHKSRDVIVDPRGSDETPPIASGRKKTMNERKERFELLWHVGCVIVDLNTQCLLLSYQPVLSCKRNS